MNHRIDIQCHFGNECGYVYEEELMEVDESFKSNSGTESSNFKCYVCTTDFTSKDMFMMHKKRMHPVNVQLCEMFGKNKCNKSDANCWFKHETKESLFPGHQDSEQVFWEATKVQFPPDQMTKMIEMMNQLFSKVEMMEKRMRGQTSQI